MCLFYSYDVIFTTGAEEIIRKFQEMDANLVISAESSIWPDPTLAVSANLNIQIASCTLKHGPINWVYYKVTGIMKNNVTSKNHILAIPLM